MKNQILLPLASLAIAAMPAKAETKKPNVVIFYMDDMGYGDMGITGAINYLTPNIDRLAHDGMLFTQFYSPAAVSSASRAGLLTGCYPNRVGNIGLFFPESKKGLNPDEEIIPEILKPKGYTSGMIGKWHLGDAPEFMPIAQGFDDYYGLPYSNDMWPYGNAKRGEKDPKVSRKDPPLWLFDGEKKVQELKTADDMDMLTTQYTERAVSFIQKNKAKPFFLYMAHAMPHIPLAVSAKFRGKSELGEYGDVMMEIDWSVGEVVKALKEAGIDKNTLVIFTSDNGPWISFGDHGGAATWREGKFTTLEGGQRVGCIMKWPDMIPDGLVCNKLTSAVDILPTLVEITGVKPPKSKIDGVSILPLLKGDFKQTPRQYLVYNDLKAVRNSRFKLILPHKFKSMVDVLPNDGGRGSNGIEVQMDSALYDLRRDPGERFNVLKKYPEQVEKLSKVLVEYQTEIGKKGSGVRPIGNIEK
jgi:arylsulfatase